MEKNVKKFSKKNLKRKTNIKEVNIGLEVHCQLTGLKTKLFCGCSTDYRGKSPNTYTCPICLGTPGTLPTVNKRAIHDALMVALALKSEISKETLFYRKNYYYPDMSKNFQISQYDSAGGIPIASGGLIKVQFNHTGRVIRIRRIQLEEDPAKLSHLGSIDSSSYTLVDYNRAGIALLEIVTEPDLESPKEARLFLQKLRSILEHLDVSDGRLEGAMRCDANISLGKGSRIEIKNISSFKEVERALIFEIARQKSMIKKGLIVDMETRHWDDVRRLTTTLRTKESEMDYRYFPEPDLVPILISAELVEKISNNMSELPDSRRERLVKQYKIPQYDAEVLTSDKTLADFFEKSAKLYFNAKKVANWILSDVLRRLHEENLEIDEAKITPQIFVEMIKLIDDGTISGKIAKSILPEMIRTGKSPKDIALKKNMIRISSYAEIEKVTEQVFNEHPQAVHDALIDNKALHYLVGQLMKITKGRADPKLANLIIRKKLDAKKR
jgi:aspartyl-tRNA(Asn)/glutamyl-tRNA(Gln) amidotransferase subunit B